MLGEGFALSSVLRRTLKSWPGPGRLRRWLDRVDFLPLYHLGTPRMVLPKSDHKWF